MGFGQPRRDSGGVFIFIYNNGQKSKSKGRNKENYRANSVGFCKRITRNLDAAEYKSVVLGLVFLKYINDCFKVKHDELVAEGAGFEEDPDEYIGDNIFFCSYRFPLGQNRQGFAYC